MKKTFLYLLFITLTILNFSCKKDKAISGPIFNIDKFEQNIINYVNWNNDSPIAWSYAINQNGLLKKSNAFGDARTTIDTKLDFTLEKEINVASISKFYTAIAALQLIKANGLTIDSTINRWLPVSWPRGTGVNALTFKDLLRHQSGLSSTNNNFDNTLGYAGLNTCISTGVINPKTRNYLNANFALFRVLIPSLWKALPGSPAINIENDANTQFAYLSYLQQNIFDKCGLTSVGCTPESRSTCTLYYNVTDNTNNTSGSFYDSWNNKSGGGGYYMTTMEIAAVNAYFEHTETLLSNDMKKIMKDERIGYDLSSGATFEIHGNYYGKNGSISNGANQGILGQIASFPINGVECVVIMNTQGVTLNEPTNNNTISFMIYQAYNDAWE